MDGFTFIGSALPKKVGELSKWNSSHRRVAETVSAQPHKSAGAVNLPLFDVPLSHFIMRPSIAVPRPSVVQTASD